MTTKAFIIKNTADFTALGVVATTTPFFDNIVAIIVSALTIVLANFLVALLLHCWKKTKKWIKKKGEEIKLYTPDEIDTIIDLILKESETAGDEAVAKVREKIEVIARSRDHGNP